MRAAVLKSPEQIVIEDIADMPVRADEVVVQPGTYNESINFNGKAIVVRSANGALVTNIRGNNNNSVVMCNTGEGANTLLQGFTLSNGGGSQW